MSRRRGVLVLAAGVVVTLSAAWACRTVPQVRRDLRALQDMKTFRCMQAPAGALVRDAATWGALPAPMSGSLAVGSDCETPGPLFEMLRSTGQLEDPMICDAFGKPLLLRASGAVVAAGDPRLDAQRAALPGLAWFEEVELLSAGPHGNVVIAIDRESFGTDWAPAEDRTTVSALAVERLLWGDYLSECPCADAWRGPWRWRRARPGR